MNELTKVKQRILTRIDEERIDVVEGPRDENDNAFMRSYTAIKETPLKKIINEEFDKAFLEAFLEQPNIEQIVKDTIKKYIDKDYDDVTELLLALNKDLCERIRKMN